MEQTIDIKKMNEDLIELKIEVAKMKKIMEEDLEFIKRTEEAWQEIDEGKCRKMSSDEFLKEIKKW